MSLFRFIGDVERRYLHLHHGPDPDAPLVAPFTVQTGAVVDLGVHPAPKDGQWEPVPAEEAAAVVPQLPDNHPDVVADIEREVERHRATLKPGKPQQ